MSRSEGTLSLVRKPEVIMVIGSICLAVFLINFYVKVPGITDAVTTLTSWVMTIELCGYLLGFTTLAINNTRSAIKQRKEWYLGIITLAFASTTVIGFLIGGFTGPLYQLMIAQIRTGGSNMAMALTGFFVISGALRAMKMKSFEHTAALLVMVVMILFSTPLGEAIWPGINPVGAWLTDIGLTAGSRAIMIGTGVGATLLGIRILLGAERQAYGFGGRR